MTSSDAPFVSVLMPVFNGGPFLARSIASVLKQEFSDFELLIVDDGSTDNSLEVARSVSDSRIRLISLPRNTGFVSALNKGLESARGVWIARQDGDDISRPQRLREQVNLVMMNSEVDLLYSDAILMDEHGVFRGMLHAPQNDILLRWDLCFRNAIPHSSVMFRRDRIFEKLGGYRRDNVSADYDLWTRILLEGRAQKSPEALVRYRLHSRSIMGTENAAAAKASSLPLREIMLENISRVSGKSFSPNDWQSVLDAWTAVETPNWAAYFTQRSKLLSVFIEQHGAVRGMAQLLSQQDYTLFHRVLRKGRRASLSFLSSLASSNMGSFRRLPWLKTAYSFIAG